MAAPSSPRRALMLVALGSATILAVGLTSFELVGPDDVNYDDVAEVVLQPADDTRSDDFVGNLDPAAPDGADGGELDDVDGGGDDSGDDEERGERPVEIAHRIANLQPFAGATSATLTTLSGRQASGTEPGLYGANRRTATCDVGTLQEFLDDDANAARVDAWSGILGIQPGDPDNSDGSDESDGDESDEQAEATISEHVDELTPVRLRVDTRVTSHGFADGQTTRFQAMLQSGTPVLVDERGVPRVACNSGNPLSDPDPLGGLDEEHAFEVASIAEDPEAAWIGFDPAEVVTVLPGPEPVDAFTLVDIADGRQLERPVGTNGRRDFGEGDFVAIVEWDSPADLDLEVVEPNGTTISTESPSPASSKGELDGDANAHCQENRTGEERISWPDGDAPAGDYEVIVRGFAVGAGYEPDCGLGPADYTLTIRIFGHEDQVHQGRIGDSRADDYAVTVDGS